MANSFTRLVVVAALASAGCVSQAQFLDNKQAMAVQTATSRGQFELNCPDASGTILSKEVVQPALEGPLVAGRGNRHGTSEPILGGALAS